MFARLQEKFNLNPHTDINVTVKALEKNSRQVLLWDTGYPSKIHIKYLNTIFI